MNRIGHVSTLLFSILLQGFVNAQTTYQLTTNSGAWNDSSVWIPSGIPGAGDFVVIDRKTVRIDSSQHTIAGFSIIDGTLLFTGKDPALTITDSAVWYDGELDGGNAAHGENKTVNSTFTIDTGAVLIIDTDSTPETHRFYEGLNVKNKGTIRHIGSSNLGIRGLSFLYNEGLYEMGSDADFTGESFTGGTLVNTGVVRKSGGSDVTQFNTWWSFHNQGGSIDVKSGTLQFANTGTFEGGGYHADSGANLNFFSGTHTFKGTLSGAPAGKVGIGGGPLSQRTAPR